MFEGTKRILVIKLRHIGDVLLTVPAIRALKDTFPGASISALVNAGTQDMLTLNPLIDEVLAYNRSLKGLPVTERVKGELGFIAELRRKKFDMTVDLTGGDRPALIGFATGARYRLGYEPKGGFAGKKLLYTHLAKRPEVKTHTVLRDLGVLRAFGIDTKDLSVNIYASPEDDKFIDGLLAEKGVKKGEPFVHVHPTSRWLFKCWTDEGMAYVMDRLSQAGFKVVVTTGPDEKELKKAGSIVKLMKTKPVELLGNIRLKHLASLSKRAAFFFGVDSAPMHIAAATGTRVISIFGPSGVFDWGQWDNRAIQGYAQRQGEVNSPYPKKSGVQVFGANMAIQKDWDCVPCGKDGCKGSKKSDCLDQLDPDYVWKALEEFRLLDLKKQ